tara:strand:+ start:255 stop:2576 length:2322 start_codon:yes stop_codon:yes gene_type:complete
MMNDVNQNIGKEDVSFNELFFIIRSNIRYIYISLSVFLLISLIYLFSVNYIYSSSSTIIIESSNSGMSSIFDVGLGNDVNYLENEIEILKSRTTTEKTIQSLLNSKHKNNLHLFNTREFDYSFLKRTLRSMFFLDWNHKIISNIDLEINDSLFHAFTRDLQENIKVTNLRNTDVLEVSYSSYNANEAAIIINTLIEVYQQRDQEWASGEMRYLKQFLAKQLKVKEGELNQIEQNLKEFQEKEHIYGLDDNSNLLLNQLTTVESDYYNTEAKRNILNERKRYFEKQLNHDEKEFTERVANTLDVQLYSIRQELSSLEADYISTKSREGDSHPAAVELNRKINNLKDVLNKETKKYVKQGIGVANPIQHRQAIMDSVISLDVLMSAYNSKLLELKNLVFRYEEQLSSLPEKYLQFSRFQRDKVILDETYSLMKQKLEETKINEASQLGKIRIVDSAKPNTKSTSPNKRMVILVCIVFGILFGIGFIFLSEFLDSTIKSIEDIERRGLPILAIIPAIARFDKENKKKKKGYKLNLKLNSSDKIERRLLTHEDPKSPISEAYRTLRTSLVYGTSDKDCKIILVSSSGPGEGKTTTIANLAITYANMGKKTLLIDADLRKPVIHKMFKNQSATGFTNFLSGSETDIKKIYYSTDVQNLSIIKSGAVPPNPSELLSSTLMDKFIEIAKKEFDIILFDTPPMIAVTDAFIINKYVNKTLLVIRASVTQKGALERTLINMANMSNSIDGVIFNDVSETNTYGGSYYYNYYQDYYGSDSKSD